MGKGKGDIAQHVRYVTRGEILFELAAYNRGIEILTAAKHKLPVLTRVIRKF